MDEKLKKQLQEFCRLRTILHRRLKNAALPSTRRIMSERNKDLIKAVTRMKMHGLNLLYVAHIIATALREFQAHKERIDREVQNRREVKESRNLLRDKLGRFKQKFPTTGNLVSYVDQAKGNPKDPLGRYYKALNKKDHEIWVRTKLQGKHTDKPIEMHLNKLCIDLGKLFPDEKPDYSLIADLCNIFELSSKKQTYRHIHNRLQRLKK
jgi:hypothetical protein